MILPSKKLMSKVLGHEIIYNGEIGSECLNGNTLTYFTNGMIAHKINIYELMHMMKEWASTKGYCIIQDTRGYTKVHRISSHEAKFWEDDEYSPSRVIDCCEWILEREGIENEM